ncbi:FimV/HubP family polar landmark protein [Psychrobacter sp. ANT_H59]|uniref:FimV/HubP family polar landmark protein n=1 Tax=Psychrobacter sp. ANT_H59 TaxID=2597354 RepID=UPI0011ED4B05|nr:FimV/HubP family polar landmark protein [Psychrobacter sp. ANT_H59]KAA0934830.1 peptigoglycan-binding protein LysM [Psychrobacter sp. ANT_H59]
MSCHLSYRLTSIHRAVSMALFYSISYAALVSSAQAATIGKTVVISAQHEPLVASIMVTDIENADFSASLANSAIYQQMGLTPTDSMIVRFHPTSATSGQVFITTTKPMSKPFADVILAINDGDQRNVIPKTLLMPLNDSLPIATSKNIVTGAKKPNLPVVSTTNAQPLTVRNGAPPPLLSSGSSKPTLKAATLPERNVQSPNIQVPVIQTPSIQASSSQIPSVQATTIPSGLPTAVATTTQSNVTTYAPSRLENGRLNNPIDVTKNSVMAVANNDNNTALTVSSDSTPSAAREIDKQLDILNIQITRQIQPKSQSNTDMMVASPMAPKTLIPNEAAFTNKNKAIIPNDSNNMVATAPLNNIPPNSNTWQKAVTPKTSVAAKNTSSQVSDKSASSEINYTVQRNDNLWVIAQQIAEKNNIDVQTVMKEIQTQNPDAFINRNANQLKADAQLSLPNYDALPSQQKLEAAISAQRQYRGANTPVAKKPTASNPVSKGDNTQATKHTEKPATTKTQILPKAQFSVLAPGHEGSADGTKTKAGMATGNGLSTEVLDLLKSSRQSTASQAQQLSKTSGTLESYTRKLQLQNQKLAELQARLKKLRNQ